MLGLVKSLPGAVHTPLIVGHNPGLHALVLVLAKDEPMRRRAVEKFPTAAFATIDLAAVRWDEIAPGTGHLRALIVSRELD